MAFASSDLVIELANEWAGAMTSLRRGVTRQQLEEFERRHHVRVPAEFAGYLSTVDGMNLGESDRHDIRFWPLAEIRSVLTELPDADPGQFEHYFIFADYCLWCHAYAIRLSEETRNDVVIVGGDSPITVGGSFADFLRHYVRSPEKLFPAR